jgi:CRP-like cAMP-binding protein/anti-anti-sigma regulatory factor
VYEQADEAALGPLRSRIHVLALEGALFFGTADRLAQEADRTPADALDLVVDLRRITTIDASGAVSLQQLRQRLVTRNIPLRLAGVRPADRHASALKAHGVSMAEPGEEDASADAILTYPDLDRAVEAAELHALQTFAPRQAACPPVPLSECRLFSGLDPAQLETLAPHLHERRLAAGERLFAEGSPGSALYLLTEGSISMVDAQRGQRFATMSPGMCFGETALLDGGGRTADAMADVASVVHELTRSSLAELQQLAPELAALIYWNLSQHLSERLRAAASAWRREAG